jgi:chemotaxis protein methyltransferase CheR
LRKWGGVAGAAAGRMCGYGEYMEMPEIHSGQFEEEGSDIGLDLLLRCLQEEVGLNFKQYKPNYLKRRIGVRMRATGCSDYMQYRQCVKQDPEEGGKLINDLTINVTEFFRDTEAYEAIRNQVIPEIINLKNETGILSIRAWSAGCATGEEPYSIAMLLLDAVGREKKRDWMLRITASDLDDKAIDKAKAGTYEEAKILPGMTLDNYFIKTRGQYAVREEVKRPVHFTILDLMKPPPLRHLDLILCRNVLIYFEKSKQQRILWIFNECLRKGGFLVLGKSEAIMNAPESGFVPFNRKERIYCKQKDVQEILETASRPKRKPASRPLDPSRLAQGRDSRSNNGSGSGAGLGTGKIDEYLRQEGRKPREG